MKKNVPVYTINNRKYKCPLMLVQSMIMSKWKGMIIWALLQHGTLRYGQLRSGILEQAQISDKMLITSLKELEADGLVIRKAYQVVPPHVEYSLSKRGKLLKSIWNQLYSFGEFYKA